VARLQYRNVLLRGIVSGNLKLIEDIPGAAVELYDLAQDPEELHDLAAARPADVRALRRRLGRIWDLSINDAILRRR
jgi:arylsulfatase A-like enzyme